MIFGEMEGRQTEQHVAGVDGLQMLPLSQEYFWAGTVGEPQEARTRPAIDQVVVHRIEVSQEDPTYSDSPADVVRFFSTHPTGRQATGGTMPYHVLIDGAGRVTQTMPLLWVTPHVRQHNLRSIGLGVLGDFRRAPPSPAQYNALVEVCAAFLTALQRPVAALCSHDGLSQGSADPTKICPGEFLPLEGLRQQVDGRLLRVAMALDWVW